MTACDGGMFDLATDSRHCGACDHDCGGAPCDGKGVCAGEAFIVDAGDSYPRVVDFVDGSFYYTHGNPDGGADEYLVRHDPDAAETVIAAGNHEFTRGATDATSLYFTSFDAHVRAFLPDGGVRFDTNVSVDAVDPIAAFGGAAYFFPGNHRLHSLDPDGGLSPFVDVAVDSPTGLAVDGTAVWWTSSPDSGTAVSDGGLGRLSLATGAISTLAPIGAPSSVAVDAHYVYFFSAENREFRRVAKDLTGPSERLATWTKGGVIATAIVLSGDVAYAVLGNSLNTGGWIVAFPTCGGVPRQLAPAATQTQGGPINGSGLALDPTHVYYGTSAAGIWRALR
jgi:hypothetical protein